MTSDDRLAELDLLRKEFYAEGTTTDRQQVILRRVQVFAAAETPHKCNNCRQPVVSIGWTRPLVEGHIYTKDGESEFRMSGMCEYCFDKLMLEPDDERRAEWFPETYVPTATVDEEYEKYLNERGE